MIESCPKKRMLLGITFLGLSTIAVLIIESHWTDVASHRKQRISPVEQNSSCWLREQYEIIRECGPCTPFELASKSIGVCIETRFKEVLKCISGDIVTRSCEETVYVDERTFWRFEAFMFVFAGLSTCCVAARKNVLNKRMIQRVQRQLANSV